MVSHGTEFELRPRQQTATSSRGEGEGRGFRSSVSSAKQILAMLRSRAAGDEERFFTIALQAAAEARQGRGSLAQDLRNAVEKARTPPGRGQTVAVPFATPRGDLVDLIELRRSCHRLDDVVLNVPLRAGLDDLVREQARRNRFREHGKTPSRRILFVGPPRSGKTMAAEALAGTLKLPLFVIRLEALITRFMVETTAKLRLAFDETAKRRGVCLFDEFNAVGGHRSASNNVAEIRRVLNSFPQFMEEPNATDSVIFGATNHPDLLDRALLRRFDLVLPFEMPTDDEICRFIKAYLMPTRHPNLAWERIVDAGRNLLTTNDVVGALDERREMREAFSGARGST